MPNNASRRGKAKWDFGPTTQAQVENSNAVSIAAFRKSGTSKVPFDGRSPLCATQQFCWDLLARPVLLKGGFI
jgi:hypothetical protein